MNDFFYHLDSINSIRCFCSVVKLMRTRGLVHILLMMLFWLGLSMDAMAQNGELRGTITDKRTGESLFGATVFLINIEFGAATNSDGQYVLSEIPANTYNIRVSFIGYQTQIIYNVVIRSEGNIDMNVQLEQAEIGLNEVIVSVNPFTKLETTPLSIQDLNQQEIASYPGGNNDIAKVIQSFPGVSGSVAGFRNDVIIRGGAPNENVYYLDGIEIPTINHFSTQGSAGGPVGLLNISFFEGVTLSTSSFAASYDNVLSGVLVFDQRNGNSRKFVGNFRLGSSESALTFEGPLFKSDKSEANTSYIISIRRSYLQLLFQAIGLPFLPDYWDYQYKVTHQIDSNNELLFTGVGSIDNSSVNELDEFDAEQKAIQDQVPVLEQQSNTIGFRWRHRFNNNNGLMDFIVNQNSLYNKFSRYTDNVNEQGLYFQNDANELELKLRHQFKLFSGPWTYAFGYSVQHVSYENTTQDLVKDRNFITDLTFLRYGAHLQASAKGLKDRLQFSAGLRVDDNDFMRDGVGLFGQISPRISYSFKLDPSGQWKWNQSWGIYYKIPPYTILGFEGNMGFWVNREAKYIRSEHFVGGFEYVIDESSRISLEAFYKKYSNYPISVVDEVSLANKGGGFEVFGSELIQSNGLGRTQGVELLFQQKFSGKWYGITSFTWYKSEFSGSDLVYRPSLWDNQFLISALAGYKLRNNWELNSRYRYLGRAPFIPTNLDQTLKFYPAIIKDYSSIGQNRLNAYNQVDIRVDKKWSYASWSLDIFFEVQNILGNANPEEPSYGLARDETGEVVIPERLVQVNTSTSVNVLPSIGLVVNF